jgi:hypothetical protein
MPMVGAGIKAEPDPILRHCERSEAIQGGVMLPWIASLRSQ